MTYWYLSFATETEALGATVVQADNIDDAIAEATRLGINPGGEVMILELQDDAIEREPDIPKLLNTLLTPKELEEMGYAQMAQLSEDYQEELDHSSTYLDEDDNEALRKRRRN